MKVNKGLGKGLSALFNDTTEDYSRFTYDENKMTEEQANAVYEIDAGYDNQRKKWKTDV